FHILGYYIGRVVVAIFTLGRIQCDRLLADTPRRKMRWGGTFHRRGQRIYLTSEMTAAIGVIFVVLLVVGGFLIYYLTR
ncbi:MAG: hypothetical protein N3I86_14465, partial [Verrucomicrobiae bacterium]|nr:hypothetical protein [Verrucomicrobiae bacterium]